MSIEEVEAEALKLTVSARAKLAERLLRSLEDLSEEEIERLWAEEALHREGEIESGNARTRDAKDVIREARSRLS